MTRLPLCVILLAALLLAGAPGLAAVVSLRELGSGVSGQDVLLVKNPGDAVSLEVVVDTEGHGLEAYSYGVNLTPGSVSGLAQSSLPIPPLAPFLPIVIDEAAGTIRDINQIALSGGTAPGIHAIDRIDFQIDAIPPGGIVIVPEYYSPGEAFLLDSATCSGADPTCAVVFRTLRIVSPAAVPALSALGLLLLAVLLAASGLRAVQFARGAR